MASTTRRRGIISEINVTPLVDIMLVLLIIFMLTAHLITKQAIEVELPRAAQSTSLPPTTIAVTLTREGALFLNDKPMTPDGLRAAVSASVAKDPKTQVIIAGDKAVSHGRVVWVLDLVKSLGVTSFAIQIDPTGLIAPPCPMNLDRNLVICAVASIVAHVAFARTLELLPARDDKPVPHKIEIRVVSAPPLPPPVEPEKPPEPPPPTPKPEVHDAPRPVHSISVAPVAKDTPPPDHPALETADTTDTPMQGISMESTSSAGGGPAMQVGNTVKPTAGAGSASAPKPLATPVAAFEATKMPLPQGRCFGKYTEDAKAAGIEGTVVLDLIVGEDGKVREVQVVEGLAHGLTEAALAALRECRFTPGEKDGKAVPVRIRGFKIRFVLDEAN